MSQKNVTFASNYTRKIAWHYKPGTKTVIIKPYRKRLCQAIHNCENAKISRLIFAFSLREHAYAIYCDFHGCKKDNLLMKNCYNFCICSMHRLWVQV